MLARVATTFLVCLGIALLVSYPLIVRGPSGESKQELAEYGARLLGYFGVTAATWVFAATGAVIVARQVRKEFRDEATENFEKLIEGTVGERKQKP